MAKKSAAPEENTSQQHFTYQPATYLRFFDVEGVVVGDSNDTDAFCFEGFDADGELWHKVEPSILSESIKTAIKERGKEARVRTLTLSPSAAIALFHEGVITAALLLRGASATEDEIVFNGRAIIFNKIFIIKVARQAKQPFAIY